MKKIVSTSLILLISTLMLGFCANPDSTTDSRLKVYPFDLKDITLLDGPFKHATELNIESLLRYEPDRLLSKFRSEAGLKPKAEPYGGWEGESLAGHSLGHHLSACALMYRTTQDKRFLERAQYIVDELEICQNADSSGYIGAMPDGKNVFEKQIAKGDINAQSFYLNGIWAPFYTDHKVMAGLRDVYHLCNIDKALEVEKKFADWIASVVNKLKDKQIQEILSCEHGGINEIFVDLYADTKDQKYLDLAGVFYHKAILDSLTAGFDILPDKHANTQIPKLIGLARRYEVTSDLNDKKAAEFFWDRVVHHHSYTTGGNGNHEYFGEPDHLRNRLSDETTETCNVYNMLKLSRHLFQWNPDAEYADFYERALFNHILSSQNPKDGRVIYNLSLEMGGYKNYEDPEGFTCCVGTGMETHSKYGRNIFYKNDDELYVSQFIAARADWKEKGVVITQTTQFPQEQGTKIEIETVSPQKFTLYIRYPYWAEHGIKILINGEEQKIKNSPGQFIALKRTWSSGDKVEVDIPFTLRLETMPDDANRVAILYGPIVLAGDLGPEDDPASIKSDYVPVILTEDRDPNHWLHPIKGASNTFEISADVANPRGFTLKPFYATHERRYSVYWDIFNKQQLKEHQAKLEAELKRKKELDAKTLDFFQTGDEQSEQKHDFKGEDFYTFDFRHKKATQAERGGWFSFDLNVKSDQNIALVVHYWGGFTGSKTFDILVDGTKIATENISGKKDGQFIDVKYNIDPGLISGKEKITIKFEPHIGHRAGPFFGARTIKR
ncbi:MAG: glycoside hydrolase family 127 protein [Ignavibacteria bacterium]|jgi:DUF1680 family protein